MMAPGQPGTRSGGPVTLGQHVPPVRGSSAAQLRRTVERGDIGLGVPEMATFQEKVETHIVQAHDSYLLAAVPHIKNLLCGSVKTSVQTGSIPTPPRCSLWTEKYSPQPGNESSANLPARGSNPFLWLFQHSTPLANTLMNDRLCATFVFSPQSNYLRDTGLTSVQL